MFYSNMQGELGQKLPRGNVCKEDLSGWLSFSKHGAGCVILHTVNQSHAWAVSQWGGSSSRPIVSRSTARPGDTVCPSPPHCQLLSCLLCHPGSWQHSSQHSKLHSVQSWALGEVFAGLRYEQMRQLRSVSLRHYVLWGGGRINLHSKPAGASPSIYFRKSGQCGAPTVSLWLSVQGPA